MAAVKAAALAVPAAALAVARVVARVVAGSACVACVGGGGDWGGVGAGCDHGVSADGGRGKRVPSSR